MARPQVADGGTASDMEGTCEYIEQAITDSRQGVTFQLGVWARCKQLFTVKRIRLRNVHRENLGPGLIIWYDPSNGKKI